MRKSFWIGLPMLLGALLYVGCDSDQVTPSGADAVASREAGSSTPSGLRMPDGTQFEERTVNGEKVLWFTLPVGFTLLARADTGEPTNLTEGGIKCTCTSGSGGCSPFRGGGIVGCAVDPDRCSECTATVTRTLPSGTDEAFALRDVVVLDRRQPVSIVETREQARRLQCGSGLLLDDPAIVEAMGEAVRVYQGPNPQAVRSARIEDLTDDALMAPFNVYGHIIWMPVAAALDIPEESAPPTSELVWDRYIGFGSAAESRASETDPEETDLTEGGAGRCNCRSGTSGCSRHTQWTPYGRVEWCEAGGCNECELT